MPAYRFVGNEGEYAAHGVPAKDLSAEDFDSLDPDSQEVVINSKVYEVVEEDKQAKRQATPHQQSDKLMPAPSNTKEDTKEKEGDN